MCLAIPMRVIKMEGEKAVVSAGGVDKNVRLDLLEGVETGDYVLIHTGYAIEKLDAEEAIETLKLIQKVYEAGTSGSRRNRKV